MSIITNVLYVQFIASSPLRRSSVNVDVFSLFPALLHLSSWGSGSRFRTTPSTQQLLCQHPLLKEICFPLICPSSQRIRSPEFCFSNSAIKKNLNQGLLIQSQEPRAQSVIQNLCVNNLLLLSQTH